MSRSSVSLAAVALALTMPLTAATTHLTTSDHAAIQAPTQADQDWCRDNGRYNDRDETFCEVRELKGSASGSLTGSTSNGSLAVTGSSRRDVVVLARVMASAPTMAEARDLARDVQVTLENGELRSEGPRTERRQSWWVSYRAEVPASYDLDLNTSNGSVTVTGVRGRIQLESSNGALKLTDLGGRVDARTSNGSVHVQANGSRWDGEGLSVVTSNGTARLDLPASYNANLVVGTNNGSLNVDFPVTVQGRIGRRLETTLGSGGATLEVRTSNGSVRVGRR